MKIRKGFVSNSSSSSFLLTTNEFYPDDAIKLDTYSNLQKFLLMEFSRYNSYEIEDLTKKQLKTIFAAEFIYDDCTREQYKEYVQLMKKYNRELYYYGFVDNHSWEKYCEIQSLAIQGFSHN